MIATRGIFDSNFINNDLAYPSPRTITSRDLVFLYDDVLKDVRVSEVSNRKPVLALSLADWQLSDSNYQSITPNLSGDYASYREYLEKQLPKLSDTFDVRVVCQANEDIKISNYLAEVFKTEVISFPSISSASTLIETYRAADYIITNRYHGLIAAIIAGTPALSVSFSTHKSQRLIDDSFPSLKNQFYTVSDFVDNDIIEKMANKDFRRSLKIAKSYEYETCINHARRHLDVLKYIAGDIAKR